MGGATIIVTIDHSHRAIVVILLENATTVGGVELVVGIGRHGLLPTGRVK